MKLTKVVQVHSTHLIDLINEINKIQNINIGFNRELLVNELLAMVITNTIKAFLDIPDDLTITDIADVIDETTDTHTILDTLHNIHRWLRLISSELDEVVMIECIVPHSTIYTRYIANQYICINIMDIHPVVNYQSASLMK